ncbi:hypothetical protein E1B28_011270 [Marasmius oreades]|uniref:Uncharacterized protein n=1 Tax=Marasmius oreades TaxID=181124 RepID=A0A9P7RTQ6_9AGAR|nr:uncharacterized protein E1B28_011270 [Marasmius oreades]KAG7089604.1 hypothetical protein E1B28_011270 [Marasmius oreades]
MIDHSVKDYTFSNDDGLFLERLEAFMDKSLAELRAFAEREERPFEEMRFRFVEWHSKHLFNNFVPSASCQVALQAERATQTRNILVEVSRILESLSHIWGTQSFILAVDPYYPANESFLGGTTAGREFWRGLRHGGETGAMSFKQKCLKAVQNTFSQRNYDESSSNTAPTHELADTSARSSKQQLSTAREVKSALYDGIRNSLRSVSGIRNAEMKWTNHDRLYTYGVSLVGWPPDIPAQNPSSLHLDQNKRLLDLLQTGTIRFEKIIIDPSNPVTTSNHQGFSSEEEGDSLFSWALQDDTTFPSVDGAAVRPPKRPRVDKY